MLSTSPSSVEAEGESSELVPTVATRPASTFDVPTQTANLLDASFYPTDTASRSDSTSGNDLIASTSDLSQSQRQPRRYNISPLATVRPHQRTRPPLDRSISSPHVIGRRNTSASVTQRITSTILGAKQAPAPQHQWSVFGQLMENEGQLRTTNVGGGRRVSRVPSINWTPGSRRSEHTTASTPRQSIADPFTNGDVQSPIAEEAQFNLSERIPTSPTSPTSPARHIYDHDDYDSDSDSSTSSSSPSLPVPAAATPVKSKEMSYFWFLQVPSVPLLYRNIFKCALAYFVASLFTFSPYLSSFISDLTSYGPGEKAPIPSGHMVATIAVYFNPAKTMGGMIEADLYCLFGLLYSSFVCLSSMSMFWWLEVQPGWEWAADVLVIIWIGASMSLVAWLKVWMASPQFNTACSMMAIILFVVLVKEGGLQTLLQVTFIVLTGSLTSNLVCYLIWPQTATANLEANMTTTLDSFATVLTMLTDTFLLEESERRLSQERLQRAISGHQNSFTSLKKNLSEARSEWFGGLAGAKSTDGDDSGGSARAYEDAVDSMNRLAQHLNGLRSGTHLQYELSKAGVGRRTSGFGDAEEGNGHDKGKGTENTAAEDDKLLRAAAEMFGDLVDDLGPPLKALSTTCTVSLKRLRESFIHSRIHTPNSRRTKRKKEKDEFRPSEFVELVDGIERALVRFESTSNHAVLRLYRKGDMESHASVYSNLGSTDGADLGDNALIAAGGGESVFLVYYFIFTLQEFSRELVSLVDAMSRIYKGEKERTQRGSWWKRSINWIRSLGTGWTWRRTSRQQRKHDPAIKRTFSAVYIISDLRKRNRKMHPSFPKVRPHAPNTIQTPPWKELSFIGRVKQSLWTIGKRLGERDTKYAVKAGMATAVLAAPAFFDATRPVFVEYWGDWALISFFVVISPTIGATNYLGLQRILGTLCGAAVAAGIYTLFPDDAVVLSIFGFLFSLPCFYYLVSKPEYASASRFVLLTYNLTCLYCYNVRQKDVSVVDVAFHRAIAVIAGVVWAALVSRFWWPSEARRELSNALGEFCLNIGWLYTRLVAANSFAPELQTRREGSGQDDHLSADETTTLLDSSATRLHNSIQEFMAMELHLQIKLIELQKLLAQAQHEPRLKGPFPVQLYRSVLLSLQTILDKLHSMRCVTTREECVRQDFIVPVNKERHEMVGNIILSFSTLASAFRLKAPLPPYLPPAEKARQRLVDAIRKLDVVKNRDIKGSRQLLFFAYALTMKGVTEELEYLGRTLQNAFGVIGQTPEEFEALFTDTGPLDYRPSYDT